MEKKSNAIPTTNNAAASVHTATMSREVMEQKLFALSKEAKRLLADKRYAAALIRLTEIVADAQALRDDPKFAALQADALSWIGFLYRQRGLLDEAQGYIDEAIDILETLQARHGNVSTSLAKVYVNKAANLLERGKEDDADMFYDYAVDVAEAARNEPCLLVEIYYEGALLFNEIEYIDDARAVLHLCDERSERLWLKKLDHLEKKMTAR